MVGTLTLMGSGTGGSDVGGEAKMPAIRAVEPPPLDDPLDEGRIVRSNFTNPLA